jgi:mono/diheme cytochrome c family protein
MLRLKGNEVAIGVLLIVLISLAVASVGAAPREPKPASKGEEAYRQLCSSCHLSGENSVKPGKPVRGSSKLATLATFKAYLSAPLGHMPYYAHVVKDPATLKALYEYCRQFESQPAKKISYLDPRK